MISRREVEHVARLARLHFDEEELARLQPELEQIIDYVEQLVGAGPLRAGDHLPRRGRSRTCCVRTSRGPGLTHEEAMANGPDVERGQFVVPRIG